MKFAVLTAFVLTLFLAGCDRKAEPLIRNYYQQLISNNPALDHVVQDVDTGAIYRVGPTGDILGELKSPIEKLRGFDYDDSLVVWCTDSTTITLLNRNTKRERKFTLENPNRIHHDLILHYPFISVLFKSGKMNFDVDVPVTDECIVKFDIRSSEKTFWIMQDALDKTWFADSLIGTRLTPHSNSIELDSDGNYYVSFKNLSQVWKISQDFSSVIYRVGVASPFKKADGQDYIGQHSVDIVRPDDFFLFDNGSTGRQAVKSRIVRVTVNPAANSYRVKNILSLPDSLSTVRMGSVHGLRDRLSVAIYNNGFHILELDSTGNIHNHLFRRKANAIKVLPELAEE